MAATSDRSRLLLQAGGLEVELAPAIGGSVASLRLDGVDVLRPLAPEAETRGDVLGVASFPMLPYANRIAGNRFEFEGNAYTVPPNNSPERFNVHGSGWQEIWSISDASRTGARLVLDHRGSEDPFRYHATQDFSLAPGGLTISTTIRNDGVGRMPFGFGHHPWFERDADVTLAFRASSFWLEAPDGVAGDCISLPPELDFSSPSSLPRHWRNNCYGGWTGALEVLYPSRALGLRIEADPIFRHLMFYSDPTRPFFCLEPQTNAACAFNKMGQDGEEVLGIIVLAPGESAAGAVKFLPFRI